MNNLIIKNTVFRNVLENNSLSLQLAEALGVQQVSIQALAKRQSSKLAHYAAVLVYRKWGLSIEDIFENAEKLADAEKAVS